MIKSSSHASALGLLKNYKGSKKRLNKYVEEEYTGITTYKEVINFGQESLSATVLGSILKKHLVLFFSLAIDISSLQRPDVRRTQVNPLSDKAGLFLQCYKAFWDL